ncbi:MAG: cardiolipin synthase [Clostridiales bacterium]|jgi:phosphatidylserine/phosphatidylglycerophosphate/cardiolipin synthase-like enzyme|nr:cardiolipin synthase [Clostridiales bacterium]MDN5283284.1 cardiolipin synthase [Candidatus Ozemobacter sp.]
MKRYLTGILLLMLFLATALPSAYADARADYERYISAYNAYRNAVIEKKPVNEIQSLLGAYLDAKGAYEGNLNRTSDEVLDGTTPGANESNSQAGFTGIEADEGSAAQVAQFPQGLRRILEQLWSEKGRKNPDAMMKLLEAYIENNPGSKFVDTARYELAKAYELLKDDQKTSAKILEQIVKNKPESRLANFAQQRLAYYAASSNYAKWKQVLTNSYNDSQQSYSKYRDTSWLAFPVKATRWVGYVKKLTTFNSNQDKFEKFQIWYENLGARFAPPVEVTFEKFKTATGTNDDSAEVSLRYTNSEAWYSRWKLLNEAKHSIDIQYFIVDKDIFGMSMLGLLYKKAKEGLKIRLMLDSRGTKKLTRKLLGQDLLQELTEMPNCEVKVFNPVHSNLLTAFMDVRKVMASNHDKILVVDNEYAIVGGRNISKDYFVDQIDHPECYRDCDVIIRSREVAAQLDFAFDEEFAKLKSFSISDELWGNIDVMTPQLLAANDTMYSHILNERFTVTPDVDKKYLNAAKEYLTELSQYSHMRDYTGFDPFDNSVYAPTKIIDKHSLGGPRNDITDQMVKYIDGCRKEVLIQNPYVVLTERIFAALQRAGRKGVTIKIHTNSPYSTDSLATQAMFYADWKKVLAEIPNAHIFVYYGKRKLHAKNWVFDGKIGIVGTYNLDYMSEQINSEVVAAIKSVEFASQLRNEIISDINNSKEYKVNVDDEGKIESVFGPDDVQGKNFWLLKTLSKFTIFKKLI